MFDINNKFHVLAGFLFIILFYITIIYSKESFTTVGEQTPIINPSASDLKEASNSLYQNTRANITNEINRLQQDLTLATNAYDEFMKNKGTSTDPNDLLEKATLKRALKQKQLAYHSRALESGVFNRLEGTEIPAELINNLERSKTELSETEREYQTADTNKKARDRKIAGIFSDAKLVEFNKLYDMVNETVNGLDQSFKTISDIYTEIRKAKVTKSSPARPYIRTMKSNVFKTRSRYRLALKRYNTFKQTLDVARSSNNSNQIFYKLIESVQDKYLIKADNYIQTALLNYNPDTLQQTKQTVQDRVNKVKAELEVFSNRNKELILKTTNINEQYKTMDNTD